MASPTERDLGQTRRRLVRWLERKLPGAEKLEVSELVKPDGSGFSNDTLFCDVGYVERGAPRSERLVLRITPSGFPIFPFYDVAKQFEVMKALGENTDVPVPRMFWREDDPSVLGGAFYVMEHVNGQIPADNPPYPTEGFVLDATPEQRAALWWNGIETLARVHRVDWRALRLDFLAWPQLGSTFIEQHLTYYERYLEWAADGRPQPTARAALDWLRRNMPKDEPASLCWGDARVGNLIYRSFEVVAVLDWEMVMIGNPELDLGWWLFVDRVTMEGNGMPGMARPRLEGLPSHEETVARYAQLMRREVENLLYYQVFAGFRFACIMMRIMQQQAVYGTFPLEAARVLERNNVVTQQLAGLLDLPPPE